MFFSISFQWSHSKSCGQLLNVQVETSDVPRGSLLELLLFNVFLRDMDSGIKCTFSNLASDMELRDAAKMLEGRGAIQRDLDKPDKWVHVNLIEFSKVKVLHLGHDNLKHNYRLDGALIESSLGILFWNVILRESLPSVLLLLLSTTHEVFKL